MATKIATDDIEQIRTVGAEIISRADYDESDHYEANSVALTRDTLDDFVAAQGQPSYTEVDEETGCTVMQWLASKKTGRRQSLTVADMGEWRAAMVG